MVVDPVPDEPAATVSTGSETLLVIADVHAGIETVLRTEGVELADRATQRRARIRELVDRAAPDRLVVLGDLVHSIGTPWEEEHDEITALLDALSVPLVLVKGNHDGEVEPLLAESEHDVTVTGTDGIRIGEVGFAHGHTWPAPEVLDAETICLGHEHPMVRLVDEVGGSSHERVWLRGSPDPEPFVDHYGADVAAGERLVVFPAFNDLSGGTRINVEGQAFLSPFLPDALDDGEAYLLDGTRLGSYRAV